MISFSNPRLVAEFSDWPNGRNRVPCVFRVETDARKGTRVSRTTTGKPKYTTYGGPACIVDGSDGKTYVLHRTTPGRGYESIIVMRSDFLDAGEEVTGVRGHVYKDSTPELFAALQGLIDRANGK